jgi:hypothetical protein
MRPGLHQYSYRVRWQGVAFSGSKPLFTVIHSELCLFTTIHSELPPVWPPSPRVTDCVEMSL